MPGTRSILAAAIAPAVVISSAFLVTQAVPVAAAPRSLTVVAVGVPYQDGSRGAVDVHLAGGGSQHLTANDLGLADGPGMQFGNAVAVADLNGDGTSDLVIGAPGNGDDVEPYGAWVVLGDAAATPVYSASGVRTLRDRDNFLGGGFGESLVVSPISRGGHEIWVGSPDDWNGAGAVSRFPVAANGTPAPGPDITEGTRGVPGVREQGDHFGLVLAAAMNGVVVGTPNEDVGTKRDAGAITRLRTSRTDGKLIAAQVFTQDSTGVPGAAEAGDSFGLALSRDGLAVGVPGEDLGKAKDAGAVQLFSDVPGQDMLKPAGSLSQDSAGVPGAAETGDTFGTALATGNFSCPGVTSVAVGAPGETIAGKADTGSVTVLPPAGSSCRATALYQGSGLPGTAETDDYTGASLSTIYGSAGLGAGRLDDLLIGATYESAGQVRYAGRAVLKRFSASTAPIAFGSLGGDEAELVFGNSPALYEPLP